MDPLEIDVGQNRLLTFDGRVLETFERLQPLLDALMRAGVSISA